MGRSPLILVQVSSMCGSADVLEALGVEIELGPESVAACVEATNMGFMFAPRYHPVMRHVAPVRKALGVRTAFNILGPMLNPAAADYALVRVQRRLSVSEIGLMGALASPSRGLTQPGFWTGFRACV